MISILIVSLWVCLIMFFSLCITFIRLQKVAEYRSKLLTEIAAKCMTEMYRLILPNVDEPYAIFESVKLETMVNRFWKPIDSFYTEEQMNLMTEPLDKDFS